VDFTRGPRSRLFSNIMNSTKDGRSEPYIWYAFYMRNKVVLVLAVAALGSVSGFFVGRSIRTALPANTPEIVTAPPLVKLEDAEKISSRSSFTWSQIESGDIQQYIANLRRIGCPERTIGDLVRAKVYAIYQAKANALFNPLARYWSTTAEMKEVDGQIKNIRTERDKFWAALHLEDSSFDTSSALSPEKQAFVAEALRLHPKAESDPSWSAQDWQSFLEARKARINYLAQYLTPDELFAYRVSQDGSPSAIAWLLQDIKPSDEEFRKVFEALDGEDLSRTNGILATGLQNKLQQALGDDRYAAYLQQQSSSEHLFNMLATSENLSNDQVQQLKQLLAASDSMNSTDYRQATANILPHPSAVRRFLMLSRKPINP
jgi:hypothetical protein